MLREIDLNAVRNRAEEPFHVAVAGEVGSGKSTLINQLLSGLGVNKPTLIRSISEHQTGEEIRYTLTALWRWLSIPAGQLISSTAVLKIESPTMPFGCYNKSFQY
jgi:putative ribosome biogenesis GTPase RsgA